MGRTQDIGSRAEAEAVDYLRCEGFLVCHTNWRDGRYELDIVARKGDTIHFVEVKCRRRGALTAPEDAVTPAKFRALQKAANAYISTYGIDLEPQFDVIAVEYDDNGSELRYTPNAMIPSW